MSKEAIAHCAAGVEVALWQNFLRPIRPFSMEFFSKVPEVDVHMSYGVDAKYGTGKVEKFDVHMSYGEDAKYETKNGKVEKFDVSYGEDAKYETMKEPGKVEKFDVSYGEDAKYETKKEPGKVEKFMSYGAKHETKKVEPGKVEKFEMQKIDGEHFKKCDQVLL